MAKIVKPPTPYSGITSVGGVSVSMGTAGSAGPAGSMSASVMTHTTTRIFIDGMDMGTVDNVTARTASVGSGMDMINLSGGTLMKMLEAHFTVDTEVEGLDPEAFVKGVLPFILISKRMREELLERGWSYESADEVANEMLIKILNQATEQPT